MRITEDMKIGDIYLNPIALDLWILKKGFFEDYDNEQWILSLVHDNLEERYLYVKGFIKLGNIYELVEEKIKNPYETEEEKEIEKLSMIYNGNAEDEIMRNRYILNELVREFNKLKKEGK